MKSFSYKLLYDQTSFWNHICESGLRHSVTVRARFTNGNWVWGKKSAGNNYSETVTVLHVGGETQDFSSSFLKVQTTNYREENI